MLVLESENECELDNYDGSNYASTIRSLYVRKQVLYI